MRPILIVVGLMAALTGCAMRPAAPPPPLPTTATPTVVASPNLITMPNVVGQNAAVAMDRLKKLGLTNIDLGTVDGHRLVILPQNWTVRTQSAAPGERLTADAKIVLGCARNG